MSTQASREAGEISTWVVVNSLGHSPKVRECTERRAGDSRAPNENARGVWSEAHSATADTELGDKFSRMQLAWRSR